MYLHDPFNQSCIILLMIKYSKIFAYTINLIFNKYEIYCNLPAPTNLLGLQA